MAKGISLGVAADTREFMLGVQRGVIDPLEEVDKGLEAIQRSNAGQQLEGDFRDAERGMERAEESVDDLRRSLRELSDRNKRETKQMGDDIAQNIDRGSRQAAQDMTRNLDDGASTAKEAMSEVKQEALANAAETFSSFDGSATSFVDGVQGTFGGLITSLGLINPALLPIGVGGAAAIGLISSALATADEESADFKAEVAELGKELIETGGIGEVSMQRIVDRLKELATETDQNKDNLRDISDSADATRTRFDRLAEAYAGNNEALTEQIELQKEVIRQAEAETEVNGIAAGKSREAAALRRDNALVVIEDLEKIQEQNKQAAESERLWLESGGPEMEAKAERIRAIDDAYDDAAGAVNDFIDEETGVFDTGAYIAAMQEREQAIKDYQTTLASSPLSPAAKAFLDSQGVEAAAQFLAGYKKATPKQQAELNRIWSEAGSENSGEYVDALQNGMPKTIQGPEIVIREPNVEAVRANIQRRLNGLGPVRVDAVAYTRNGEPVY